MSNTDIIVTLSPHSMRRSPIGSPGMEMDRRLDLYDTLLVSADGTPRIFAGHRGSRG